MDQLLLLFSHSVVSDSLWPHGLQQARLPCPSPSPGACSNPCPLSRWCHPTILSSVSPCSSCLQSFLATGSFLMSQLFASTNCIITHFMDINRSLRYCRLVFSGWSHERGAKCLRIPLGRVGQPSGWQSVWALDWITWHTWFSGFGAVKTLEHVPSVWPSARLRACPWCHFEFFWKFCAVWGALAWI